MCYLFLNCRKPVVIQKLFHMCSKECQIIYNVYTFIKHEQSSDKPTTNIKRPTYTYNKCEVQFPLSSLFFYRTIFYHKLIVLELKAKRQKKFTFS